MSTEAALSAYLDGIGILRSAMQGLTPDQLRARPVAGKWTILEVACHIADFDTIYADRIKRIIAEDRPLLISSDHDAYVTKLAYHDRDLEEELNVVEATRRQLARTLRALPEAALDRPGLVRTDSGGEEERTALRHLTLITGHIPHHLAFVAEKKKALGLG